MPADVVANLMKNGHTKEKEDSVEIESVRDETDGNQFLATDDLIRDLIGVFRRRKLSNLCVFQRQSEKRRSCIRLVKSRVRYWLVKLLRASPSS